jgi:hypothetical protein
MLSPKVQKITQYRVYLDGGSLPEIAVHGGRQLRPWGCEIQGLPLKKGVGLRVAACVSDVGTFVKRRKGEGGASGDGHDFTNVAAQQAVNGSGGRELHPLLPHVLHDVDGDCSIEARAAQRLIGSL